MSPPCHPTAPLLCSLRPDGGDPYRRLLQRGLACLFVCLCVSLLRASVCQERSL